MREITGALFDLDGVIIDTEGIYTQFWENIDHLFPTGVPNFSQVIKGSNLATILNDYFAVENHETIVEMLNEHQHTMAYTYFEGAVEYVDRLRATGVKCCLVTSSDYKKMISLEQQHPDFISHFDGIINGDMVTKPKPHPECFLMGSRLIGEPIEKCVVFEDSLNGIAAGKASGALVVGIATTNSCEKLKEQAHLVFSALNECPLTF